MFFYGVCIVNIHVFSFCRGVIVAITFLIAYATWFESKLNSNKQSIDSELNETERKETNNTTTTTNNNENNLNDKAFELYQMNSTDNNNVDVEAAVAAATNFTKIKSNEHENKDEEKLKNFHTDPKILGINYSHLYK